MSFIPGKRGQLYRNAFCDHPLFVFIRKIQRYYITIINSKFPNCVQSKSLTIMRHNSNNENMPLKKSTIFRILKCNPAMNIQEADNLDRFTNVLTLALLM